MNYKISVVRNVSLTDPACIRVETEDLALMRKLIREVNALTAEEHKPLCEDFYAGGTIFVARFRGDIRSIHDGLIAKGYSVEKL